LDGSAANLLESLRIHGTLSEAEVRTAASLAEAADAKYSELQKLDADPTEILKWFSTARLLTAMAVGFRGTQTKDGADALYELSKTCDDPSELIKAVESDVHFASKR
jgi:hypothetical protein